MNPIPRDPPVTTAVFPSMENRSSTLILTPRVGDDSAEPTRHAGPRSFRRRRPVDRVECVPGTRPLRQPRSSPRAQLRSVGRPSSVPIPRSARVPHWIATAVAASGVLTLVSAAFSPSRFAVMWHSVPLPIRSGASSAAALAGAGTIVLAGALARRQRRAWLVTITLLVVATVAHLLKDLDAPSAGVSLGMALVLFRYRSEFDAKPGPGTFRRAVFALPMVAGVVWAFGVVAILGHANTIRPHPGLVSAALETMKGASGVSMGVRFVGPTGRWIPIVLPILGMLGLATALVLLFRPAVEGLRHAPGDAERARDLVPRV